MRPPEETHEECADEDAAYLTLRRAHEPSHIPSIGYRPDPSDRPFDASPGHGFRIRRPGAASPTESSTVSHDAPNTLTAASRAITTPIAPVESTRRAPTGARGARSGEAWLPPSVLTHSLSAGG